MKRCFSVIFAMLFTFLPSLLIAGPRVDFLLQIFPKEISWGDPFFVCLTVKNEEDKIINLIHRHNYGPTIGVLFSEEDAVYHWFTPGNLEFLEGVFLRSSSRYPSQIFLLQPQEECVVYFGVFWVPLPGHPMDQEAEELRQQIKSAGKSYIFNAKRSFRFGYNDGNIEAVDIWNTLSKEDYVYETMTEITLKPRPKGELSLLHDWFFEIPCTSTEGQGWSENPVFSHCFHVRNSPYNVSAETREDYQKKREKPYDDMNKFLASMETRTPELLERIKRTKEIEAEIVERSKRPNSTISTNMAEFVQLRGFLVDIRYAKDRNAEKAAFDSLCDWLESAHDKELWVKLLSEIGFKSVFHREYFSESKVERYVESLHERFDNTENKTL